MAGHKEEHGEEHGEGEHKKHKKHHPHAHPEHEHEEGWIVSFADNVLLMMGFFVILLAMNMGPKGKSDSESSGSTSEDRLLDVAIAVREAFHNPVSVTSLAPEDQPLIRRLRERSKPGNSPDPGAPGEDDSAQTVRPGTQVGHDGFVQFADNSALLTTDARLIIASLAAEIAGSRWMVEVRGHSSRVESWGDTRKARDLSYQRAWAVGNELVALGAKWEQIRLVSSGDSAPIIPRARTADERETNQRTEILILNETVPPDPFGEKSVDSGNRP
jgi:outer membrane protein OmpA-like peptidoglycan-associated protein